MTGAYQARVAIDRLGRRDSASDLVAIKTSTAIVINVRHLDFQRLVEQARIGRATAWRSGAAVPIVFFKSQPYSGAKAVKLVQGSSATV